MKNQKVRHAFAGTTRQTRLNVFDGLYRTPEEIGVRHSINGQKLRDIIDPRTGFCVNAVTPTFNQYDSGMRMAKRTSGAGKETPRRDESTGRWYDPETGYVCRETTDGDAPLPRTRIVENPTLRTPKAEPVNTKVDSPRRATHLAERKRAKQAPLTDDMIREYLRLKYGKKITKITPRIRQAVRAAMVHSATVKAYSQDLRNATK
jgi:hypothetical protein